jgi:hypothetical protein
MTDTPAPEADLDALIWECKAIAKVVGLSARQTFYLLQRGYLPATKVGQKWVTTRRRLLAALEP